MKRRSFVACLLLLVATSAFVVQGYHPGAEDDAVYLSAIKKDLKPSLYPYNSEFITLQMQATIFDEAVAETVKATHLPVAYVCLLLQISSIFLLLSGCWAICAFCFQSFRARLAGVLTVACLLALPVAGTALYISDEHLHPRVVSTDAILFAIASLQRKRPGLAALFMGIALAFHPIMAMFGISLCIIFVLTPVVLGRISGQRDNDLADEVKGPRVAGRGLFSIGGWLFSPATPEWRQAVMQHSYYLLMRWTWYEWMGAWAPPLLLWLLVRLGRRRSNQSLVHLAATVALFSVIQLVVALGMLLPPAFERLIPLQPMRYLHLTLLLMALMAGAVLGEYVLKGRLLLWVLVFVPLAAANGYAQRLRYPGTRNLELPWTAPQNPWVQAFEWVRVNTPPNAVFALDPHYLALPGEDNHSFRALAERSALVDDTKDAAVVTQVPTLGQIWLSQHNELKGWRGWKTGDFLNLAETTSANWVIVTQAQGAGLTCPYTNKAVRVCKLICSK